MTKLSWLWVGYSSRLLKLDHSSCDWRTLRSTVGHSAVLDTEIGCLQFGSVLIDGRSVEFTKTPIGLGLRHFEDSLSISDSPVNRRMLQYELGVLGLLGYCSI